MVEGAPSSVDLQDFQFKLHSKCKIFDNTDDSKFKNSYNLVAAASRYGLIFVGSSHATVEVVQLKTLENIEHVNVKSESQCAKRSISLPAPASHLTLNCDSTLLAVVCNKNDCATAIIYNVPSFLSQNVSIVREIRLSATPSVKILETCWNPTISTVLTACKSDGSLGVYNIQETSVDINELPVAAGARCFCWSPKGKQIVVGSANGSLTQYKPDLKAVKVIQTPALTGKGPFAAVSVFWLTNYQFVTIYKDLGDEEARPMILIVNAPKTGNTSFINYDDICYSNGNLRQPQYYIIHQPTWGVLLVASANSMEVGVLGISQAGEPALWQQWNQIDAARAELPLSANHQDTFPVGLAFDTGITMQLPWGENQSLPPMPMIHILSHHGVLCSFSVINLKQGVPTLCTPPEAIADQSGINQFVLPQITQTTTISKPEVKPSQPNLFGSPAPIISSVPADLSKPTTASSIFSGVTLPTSQQASLHGNVSTGSEIIKPGGTLFGGNGGTLFGASSGFGAQPSVVSTSITPTTSNVGNLNFKMPTNNLATALGSPMFSSVNTTPVNTIKSPASNLNISASVVPTLNTNNTVNAANLSLSENTSINTGTSAFLSDQNTTPQNFGTPISKPSMFGMSMTSAPNYGSLMPKPSTTNASLNTSAPLNLTPNFNISNLTPQNNTILNMPNKSMSQSLLNTPKETSNLNLSQKTSSKSDLPESSSKMSLPLSQSQTLSNDSFISKKEEPVITDQMIQNLIKEEVKNFQRELEELFHRCKNINLDVGTEDEKSNLILKTESLLEFYRELKDTTDGQISEVHYLKQALMQSFAWYEDTKARHKRYTDPNFASLLQAQELDPISEKQLADIKHLIYYIEAQLKQIDGFLDCQWADFQDSCKKHIKGKLHIPTLEPIYQSLVRQNAILERHKYLLKDIGARIKSRNKKAANYPHVMNKFNLKTDKENIHLDDDLRNLKIDDDIFANRYEKIVSNKNKFTANKESKLCSFFSNRNVTHIAPKKPKFVSNVLQISPSKLASSYTASPGVNRSLRSTFDNLAQESAFDSTLNTSVEANLSSTNLFSFTLLDGAHSTKLRTPEKETQKTKTELLFNTPKANTTQQLPASGTIIPKPKTQGFLNFTSNSEENKIPTSTPIFNFTASSTAVTQSKPQFFTSGTNIQSPATNFTFDQSKFISNLSDSAKTSQSNTTFFSFNSQNTGINTSQNKMFEMKSPETAKDVSVNKQAEITLIKPNVVKSGSENSMFGSSIAGDDKTTQPFSFIVPQSKPVSVPKDSISVSKPNVSNLLKASGDNSFVPRDSLEAGFHFSSLGLGQQSTPKPKPTSSSLNFGQMLGQSSAPVITSASIIKPVTTTADITLTPVTTVSAFPKQSFSFTQPPISSSSNPPSSTDNTVIDTQTTLKNTSLVIPKPDQLSSTITIEPVSTGISSTPTSSDFSIKAITSSATSIFGGTQITPTSSSSLFGGKPLSPSTSLFDNKNSAPTTTQSNLTTPEATTPQITSSQPASTASTGFSFTQLASAIPSSETPKSPSIFGGNVSSTTSTSSIFSPVVTDATTPTPTSNFSFLQPAAVATTQSEAVKTTSLFSTPTTTIAQAQKTPSIFGSTATSVSTPNTNFGFTSPTTTSDNSFSFGKLSVTALSPNANTTSTTTTVTTANASTFSFALPASTVSTTSETPGFNNFGSQNIFNKPVTTTTASSFMGQPICSPSSFSQSPQNQQSSGSIFGQSSGNIFAQKATTASSGGSIFGQTTGSLFGQTNTSPTTSTTSIFGQTQSSPFGAPAQSTASTTGSIFGSNFGNATVTTAGSIFGQSSFGTPVATSAGGNFSFTQSTQNSGFGNSGGSIFGTKSNFGATPAFGQPPAFGSPSAFGSTPTTGSIFGNQSQTNTAGSFGSGFGSPSSFGQKPAFGSPPSFAQSSFGSPPAFGGAANFGSPQRVFGATTAPATGAFGATVQENSTFANLANQSTLGFGSLAQNQAPAAPQAQTPQFSGGAQFSSWR